MFSVFMANYIVTLFRVGVLKLSTYVCSFLSWDITLKTDEQRVFPKYTFANT